MKIYTRLVHSIVRFFRIENLCISLGRKKSFFLKALPLSSEYECGTFVTIKRNDVFFKVDRADYMQWYLYADLPDISWKKALVELKSNCVVLDIGANCGQFSLRRGVYRC